MLLTAQMPALPADQSVQSIDQTIEECRENPRFRVGGAMIGDCLTEHSRAVDREIDVAIADGERRYCAAKDREDYRQSHSDWLAYRKRMCDLVERSPGNTPSWVNSAACRLELGRQRLVSLKYTGEYGTPRCSAEG
ncbi:lysozyme inhibitor LprI family protein [Pelagerythrobacter rhizovicinus]|nr:lysozyme inhibitor LprI family protein [Pelagerythrobacter rhizovicinus]